jgi:hypothetical protein
MAVRNGIAVMDSAAAAMTGSSNTIVGFVVRPHENVKRFILNKC